MSAGNRLTLEEETTESVLQSLREAWQTGARPDLEGLLETHESLSQTARRRTLCRLVMLEIELRRERGESIDMEAYRHRFPELPSETFEDFVSLPPPRPSVTPPLLPSRYRPVQMIGQGGLGVVWRVKDSNLERSLAVKVPRDELQWDQETNARLQREAMITGQLQHPGIPAVVEQGQLVTGVKFFSMKLVEGRTLAELMADRATSEERRTELLEVLLQVSEAVAYAHAQGVIHCDLKPQNVMVGQFGEVQLMDWGMARLFSEGDQRLAADSSPVHRTTDTRDPQAQANTNVGGDSGTRAGQVMGSPAYMAPEQARGERHATDPRTDVYALAAILYELLTRRTPAAGRTSRETLEQARQGNPPPVRNLEPRVPVDLAAICMKGLSYDPAQRYTTAEEFADDLQRWLRGLPIRAHQHSLAGRLGKWVKRRPAVAALAAVSVIALLGLTTLGVLSLFYRQLQSAHADTVVEKRRADGLLVTANEKRAEVQRLLSETQQKEAQTREAKGRAETAEKFAQRVIYAADMELADRAIQDGKIAFAEQLLQRYHPEDSARDDDLRGFEWYYLKQRCNTAELVIELPDVRAAVFSRDALQILAGKRDGEIVRFDLQTGQPVGRFDYQRPQFCQNLESMHWWNRDRFVLKFENGIVVLQASTGDVLFEKEENIHSLAFSPQGQHLAWIHYAMRQYGEVHVAEIKTGNVSQISLADDIGCVAFAGDQELILGDENGQLRRCDLAGGIVVEPVKVADTRIVALQTNDTSEQVAVACQRRVTLRNANDFGHLWQSDNITDTYLNERQLVLPRRGTNRIALSDGHLVIEGQPERSEESTIFYGHESEILSLQFGERGRLLSTSRDGTIRVWSHYWNPPGEKRFLVKENAYPLGFDREGKKLMYLLTDQAPMQGLVVDVDSGERLAQFEPLPENFLERHGWNFALNPQGNQLVVELWGHGIQLIDLLQESEATSAEPQLRRTMLLHHFQQTGLSTYSPQGRLLAVPELQTSTDADNYVLKIWDVGRRAWTQQLDLPGNPLAIALSPDEQYVAVATHVNVEFGGERKLCLELQVWDIASGRQVHRLDTRLDPMGHQQYAQFVMGIDTDNRLLIGSSNLERWDLASGQLLGTGDRLKLLQLRISSLEFDASAERAFLGISDGTCEVWDLVTFRKLITLRQKAVYTREFERLKFDDRGVLMSTGSGSMMTWDGQPQ